MTCIIYSMYDTTVNGFNNKWNLKWMCICVWVCVCECVCVCVCKCVCVFVWECKYMWIVIEQCLLSMVGLNKCNMLILHYSESNLTSFYLYTFIHVHIYRKFALHVYFNYQNILKICWWHPLLLVYIESYTINMQNVKCCMLF